MTNVDHATGPLRACNNGKCRCRMLWTDDYPVATVTGGDWGDDFPALEIEGTPGSCTGELNIKAVMDRAVYGNVPQEVADANSRRLVACWNACQGIPTEALETGRVRDTIDRLMAEAEGGQE